MYKNRMEQKNYKLRVTLVSRYFDDHLKMWKTEENRTKDEQNQKF